MASRDVMVGGADARGGQLQENLYSETCTSVKDVVRKEMVSV
jgi:hypothetical protein